MYSQLRRGLGDDREKRTDGEVKWRIRKLSSFLLAATFTAYLIGCGGGSNGSSSPPPTPDFSLSVQPAQLIVPLGGTVEVTVAATGENGFTGVISVTGSGQPTGLSEAPAGFSLTAGQDQVVTLTSSASEATGPATLTWTGTSGALTHATKENIKVENAPTVSSPTRTTFVRNDSTPIENTDGYPFALPSARYDPVHKNFFVSNTWLNRVEVYSAQTEQLVATIPVPMPVGLDLTVAYDLLYVGTLTDFLFVIDTSKLQAVQRIASELMLPGKSLTPVSATALSDGRVLLTTCLSIDGCPLEVIWNPYTETGQDISHLFNQEIGITARSGDHSKILLLPAYAGNAFLFDATNNSVISAPANFGISFAAGNQDGSLWYVEGYGPVLAVLNSQLQQIAQGTVPCCSSDFVLSRDGQTLYSSADGFTSAAFDAATLQYKGWISSVTVEGFIDAADLKDVDETGLIIGMEDHGVAFLDASIPLNTGSSTTGFNLGYVTPDNSPLSTSESITMEALAGANSDLSTPTIYFGPDAGSNVSLKNSVISVTSPASPFPGPVNVFSSQNNGNLAIVPYGFSYGPSLVYEPTNASVANGGGPADFFTFGAGSSAPQVQFGFGGTSAPVNSIKPGYAYIPYAFLNLQDLEVTVPPGSTGNVGLSLTAPSGTTSVPGGFRYYPPLQAFSLSNPSLQQGSYDAVRNRIYFTDVDHIEVFDAAQQGWTTPISLPGAKTARSIQSISLSPNGNVLALGDIANGSVLVLNPDLPSSVDEYQTGRSIGPTSVSTINSAVYFWSCDAGGGGALRKLDLTTGRISGLNIGCSEPHDRLSATADGSELFAYIGGFLYSVDTSTDKATLRLEVVAVGDYGDMAVTPDGAHTTSADAILDDNFYFVGEIAYVDAATLDVLANYGMKWYPTGSLILQPLSHQVDVIDGNTGLLRDRISLPVTVPNVWDALVVDTTDNALFLITSEGIAELLLSSLPIGIGAVSPSEGPAGGGSVVTIQGNSFDSDTQLLLDGVSVPVTVVDNQTLSFVTPAHAVGGVALGVNNSSGQAYVLQNAFTFASGSLGRHSKSRQAPVRRTGSRAHAFLAHQSRNHLAYAHRQ